MRLCAIIVCFVWLRLACPAQPLSGEYRGALHLHPAVELPFNFSVEAKKGRRLQLVIRNADERITVSDLRVKGDSLFFQMPVFDTEFRVRCAGDSWSGIFINHYRVNERVIPFTARRNVTQRFTAAGSSPHNVEGRWHAVFSPASPEASHAVALFHHIEQTPFLSASFLTETGDFRYLEGQLSGDSLYLSAFDGSHAFLFLGEVRGDSVRSAMFYSGRHWQEPWLAGRDEQFRLRDADSITSLKKGEGKLSFTFKNTRGRSVSLDDRRYKGKPVVVQLMGSWCPNCMDESRYLAGLHQRYQRRGLEIVALAFEKSKDEKKTVKQLEKLRRDLDIPYDILITGAVGKDEASRTMEVLSGVTAFPTTLFLDREHRVVRIHTGFNGPATGKAHEEFKRETEAFIDKLLK